MLGLLVGTELRCKREFASFTATSVDCCKVCKRAPHTYVCIFEAACRYGDLTPSNRTGKVFFGLYIIGSLVVQLTVLTTFVDAAASAAQREMPGKDSPVCNRHLIVSVDFHTSM